MATYPDNNRTVRMLDLMTADIMDSGVEDREIAQEIARRWINA